MQKWEYCVLVDEPRLGHGYRRAIYFLQNDLSNPIRRQKIEGKIKMGHAEENFINVDAVLYAKLGCEGWELAGGWGSDGWKIFKRPLVEDTE